MSTGQRHAPEHDLLGVDAGQPARVRDRGAVVVELSLDAHELARLALARAQVAEVEQQRVVAGGGELLGIGLETTVAGVAKGVAHDDAWAPVAVAGRAVPGGAASAVRDEIAVASHAATSATTGAPRPASAGGA